MQGIVNIEGKLFPPEKAQISIFDHGFLYGDSVYETLRTYGRKPFLLDKHIDRLYQSAKGTSLNIHWDKKRWGAEVDKSITDCKVEGELYIRTIVTRGVGKIGLDPSFCPKPTAVIIVKALPEEKPEQIENGMKLQIVDIQRNSLKALPPYLKTGNFLNNILAFIEAKNEGADEAIMCNAQGNIAEATMANIFMIKGGKVFTPPNETGILPGITKALILDICKTEGLPFEARSITPQELMNADELFISSTIKEVAPATMCNGKKIGDGKAGPITKDLRIRFNKKVEELMKGV